MQSIAINIEDKCFFENIFSLYVVMLTKKESEREGEKGAKIRGREEKERERKRICVSACVIANYV